MKKTDNHQEDIVTATNRLSDINYAINRDQGIAEQKAKEAIDLSLLVDSKKLELSKIEKYIIDGKTNLEKLQSQAVVEKENMDNVRRSIQKEIDSINANMEGLSKELESAKVQHIKSLNAISIEYKKKEDELISSIGIIKSERDTLDNESMTLKAENANLLLQSQKMQEDIYDKCEDIYDKNTEILNIDREIESKININKGLSSDIENKEEKIQLLQEEVETILLQIDWLDKKKIELDNQVSTIEQERSDFIKAKMQLQKDRQDLNNREDVVKEKYQEAGLVY